MGLLSRVAGRERSSKKGGKPTPERCRVVRIIARLNVGGPALQALASSATGLDPDRFELNLNSAP